MADEKTPIYQDILDLLDESVLNSGVFSDYSSYPNQVQPINWINNITRLNQGNMNAFYEFIASYANWAGSQTAEYLNNNVLRPMILQSAGWSTELKNENPAAGEIFSDYTNNKAFGKYSSSFGENNVAAEDHQFVIGKFNADDSNAAFIVGYGNSDSERKNIATINKDGVPTVPTDLIHKGYFDTELDRIKQLNQWIGNVEVTSEEYDLENNNRLLRPILSIFVENQSPVKRHPRNGDLVTVTITDKKPTDPQYPTMWIYLVPDPYNPPDPEGQVIDDYWQFYSSQQELLNASKDVKGLVQIGDNINVNNGLISIPLANGNLPGVVLEGNFITIRDGKVSISSEYTEDVSRQLNNLDSRLTTAESNIENNTKSIELNSQNINNISATVDRHDKEIKALQTTTSSLDSRVSSLEAGGGGGEVKGIYWIEF